MPAAVAVRYRSEARLSMKGANDPSATFQASGSHIGTRSSAPWPPRSTGAVNTVGSSCHQPLTNAQKIAANDIVQNETASGEVRTTCFSPTRK